MWSALRKTVGASIITEVKVLMCNIVLPRNNCSVAGVNSELSFCWCRYNMSCLVQCMCCLARDESAGLNGLDSLNGLNGLNEMVALHDRLIGHIGT